MKEVLDGLKASGADQPTINFFLKMLTVFIAFLGSASLVLAGVLVVIGITPPIWLVAIVTTISGVALSLLTSAHQTSVINGTAAQAATDSVKNVQPALDQAKVVSDANAATIQAIMTIVEQMNNTTASSITATATVPVVPAPSDEGALIAQEVHDNTAAVQRNTSATADNTASTLSAIQENTEATVQNTEASARALDEAQVKGKP